MARKTGSHSEITGPKIRSTALRLFAQHGYAAVSMRQIAREVGVQAGALYLYTPDKQSLLFDLMESHMIGLIAAWRDQNFSGNPREMLRLFTRFHILYHIDRPDAVFVAYMELRNLTPENFIKIEALRREYEETLAAILVAGQSDGCFSVPDIKLATLALIAMLTGVNTWYRESGRFGPDRVEAIYWEMVEKAVAA